MCIRDRVGLSRAVDNAPDANEGTWRLMIEGLFTTVTNVNFNEKTIRDLIDRVHAEKARDRKSTRLNSSHLKLSRMPSSA